MKQELDALLCEKYPKMMVNRHKPMQETCMCWGFECGDGWYNILNQLMGNIQHHIDWRNESRERALEYNQMIEDCKHGDFRLFNDYYKSYLPNVVEQRMVEILEESPRFVPEPVPQVVLDQVKEKFGTLRFYYTGGDDVIDGMVRMAESMSGVTCERCGAYAETNWPKSENGGIGGWVRTICKPCDEQREAERTKQLEEYEFKKLLKQGHEQ
jgi:hypothetical protein